MADLSAIVAHPVFILICFLLIYKTVLADIPLDGMGPIPQCPPCLVQTQEELDEILRAKAIKAGTIGGIYVFVAASVSFLVYSKRSAITHGLRSRYETFRGGRTGE